MIRFSSTWDIGSSRHLVSTFGLLLFVAQTALAGTPLATVLDQTAGQVQRFWDYFPAVTCTEMLWQSKLDAKGKALSEQRTSYDYLMLLQSSGNQISVEESRVEKGDGRSKGKATLMVTNGFSILSLIFHPLYQSSYEFTELPADASDGGLLRVAFRHHASRDRSPSVLVLRGREYPLEWKGTAWLDRASLAVVRIQAQLATSMEDIGLLRLDTDVTYAATRFDGTSLTYWLPTRAVVEAATRRQHWRNTHLFQNYRRFNVETEVKTAAPQ